MYSLHGPQQPSAYSDWLISAHPQQQAAGSIQPLMSQNMQPNGADVCYQQQQGPLHHTPAAGACSNAAPAGYVQQQRHCTAAPGANSMMSQQTASAGPDVTHTFSISQQQQQQQQQEPMQCTAAGQLLGAVMNSIEQELQREIRQFAGAVVQRHKQQLLKEIQSLSLAAAAAAGATEAHADVPGRPSSSMAAADAAGVTGCGSCTCNCHRHAAAAAAGAPAGYIAAACNAAAACQQQQQQQQQMTASYPPLPLGTAGSNEPSLISFMSAGAAVAAAAAAVPAAAPLSNAHSSLSHDSMSLALPCSTPQQQQQQQRVDSPARAGANSSGTEWSLQSNRAGVSPAAHAAAAPGSSVQQSFAFAAAGGASCSSSPTLCVSMPTPTAGAGFAAALTPASVGSERDAATISPYAEQYQKAGMCQVLQNPAQQQQQQLPCADHQQSFSSLSMHSSQLLDLPSLPPSAFYEQQQQQQQQQPRLVHSPADVSQTGTGTRSSSGAAEAWPLLPLQQQQQQLGEADLFACFDAACEDSTEPIAENIFEEIDALLGDGPLDDVLDPVMGFEDQPLLLQASLQQVQQQLQQLEQLQQQPPPAPYAQLQLDVSSATCSAAAADQLYSPCDQQQQQLTPCSAQVAAAPAAVFAQPRPLHRSFSACSSKSNKSRTAAAGTAGSLTPYGSQSCDLTRKRSRMLVDVDPAAAAAAPVSELRALKRQGSNKSSSSGGDVWSGGWQQPVQQQQQQHWQQQQQQAVGVDLMAQLPPWLTRQVSITASLASHSQ